MATGEIDWRVLAVIALALLGGALCLEASSPLRAVLAVGAALAGAAAYREWEFARWAREERERERRLDQGHDDA
jgi:hypothetical protein